MSEQDTVEAPQIARATGDVPKERRCMSCGKPFASQGWHNRMCNSCQKRSVPYDAVGVRSGR
jgi:hypothetical protein